MGGGRVAPAGRTPTGARNHFKRLRERDAKLAAQTALVVHSPVALECHERLDAAAALRVEVEGDADGDVAPWSAEELASADWSPGRRRLRRPLARGGRRPRAALADGGLRRGGAVAADLGAPPRPRAAALLPGPAGVGRADAAGGGLLPAGARVGARAEADRGGAPVQGCGPDLHLVGDGPTYMCLFDGCGKMYSSTDSARKHCRQRHTAWLRSRDQRLGTRAYCMPIGEHTWTDGERYL